MSRTNETDNILMKQKVSTIPLECLYNSEHTWKTREKSQVLVSKGTKDRCYRCFPSKSIT